MFLAVVIPVSALLTGCAIYFGAIGLWWVVKPPYRAVRWLVVPSRTPDRPAPYPELGSLYGDETRRYWP